MSKAKCKNCNHIVESKTVHDWNCCKCYDRTGNHGFYLDGGQDYTRVGGNFKDIIWIDPINVDIE